MGTIQDSPRRPRVITGSLQEGGEGQKQTGDAALLALRVEGGAASQG